MKNIKITILSLIVVAFFGCDQDDNINTVFDNVNGQSLVAFAAASSDLAVVIDGTGTVDVQIEVSTVSDSDRTVTVSVDESSTAATENYALASNMVTIPAGSYSGLLTINGVDVSVEPQAETIVLNIEDTTASNPSFTSNQQHTVNIFQICPVPSDYLVGDYILTDNGNGNFGQNVPVTISVDPDEATNRTFVAEFLPGTGVARDVDVVLTLGCNFFNLNTIDINVTCTQVTGYVIGGAGASNSMYDLDNDDVGTVHTVNYLEDLEADCGPTVVQNFTLTKI
ncbi:DUF1735 domain-containing protein [Psychroserpens algicola]|uniref:DUF1735 domain-containing protein n=1 Tax=Psychroserpens algicola TaxID=1719034 RepID=UPI0019533E25|nr:DUF1735 domain-containing protein [Psychroserpens algicola]